MAKKATATPTTPTKNIDTACLLGFLLFKFKEHKGDDYDVNSSVDEFVDYANQWLIKNPPSSVDFRSMGLGIQLKTGERVTLCPSVPYDNNIYDPETSVTNKNRQDMFNLPHTPFIKV